MGERAQQLTSDAASATSTEPTAGPSAAALNRAAGPALDRIMGTADPTTTTDPLPKDTHPFAPVLGKAFVGAAGADISPVDVRQGEIGDCWFTAAMAAIARTSPDSIRRLIHDRGDGTYDVTIYVPDKGSREKKAHVVTVNSEFPSSDGKPIYARSEDQGELWPMLLEKAYATWAGSYSPLNDGKDSGAGLDVLTAGPVETYLMLFRSKEHVFDDLAKAFADHRPVVLASHAPSKANLQRGVDLQLMWPHAYSLEGVDTSAQTVSVRNSDCDDDGITHTVVTLTLDDLDHFFNQYAIGPKS